MVQTLQYGVTRAQESEAVNSHIICEETSKIGFFCDSVTTAHGLEPAASGANGMALLTDSGAPIECFSYVPPWKGGTFVSGICHSGAVERAGPPEPETREAERKKPNAGTKRRSP